MTEKKKKKERKKRGIERRRGVLGSIETWISGMDYCHQIPCLDWGLGGLIQPRAVDIIQKAWGLYCQLGTFRMNDRKLSGRLWYRVLHGWSNQASICLCWWVRNELGVFLFFVVDHLIYCFSVAFTGPLVFFFLHQGRFEALVLFTEPNIYKFSVPVDEHVVVQRSHSKLKGDNKNAKRKKSSIQKHITQHSEPLIQHNCDKQKTLFQRHTYFLAVRPSVSLFLPSQSESERFKDRASAKIQLDIPSGFQRNSEHLPIPISCSISFIHCHSSSFTLSHLRLINLP